MKKFCVFLLCFILMFSFTSCMFNYSDIVIPNSSIEYEENNENDENENNENDQEEIEVRTEKLNTVNYSASGSYTVIDDNEYLRKLSRFSNKIYEMTSEGVSDNYVVSPLSIYMALAILHYIGDENVKSDIENLFGMSNEDIARTGELFLSLVREREFEGNIISKLDLTNSIWLDTQIEGNKNVLDSLAEQFFCYAFKTPFSTDIKKANEDIREFIKEQTNGLIDKDFDLSMETLFAIINTLYFKDIWNDGFDLQKEDRVFHYDTTNKEQKITFLLGNYNYGQVVENDICYYFYTTTESNYKVKFILPKEGYKLSDVMTKENLNEINEQKNFKSSDENYVYKTRCIFPKFKVESETDLKDIFEYKGYLSHAFTNFTSDLIDRNLAVSEIIHNVVFNVDEEGVEGAAVTIIAVKETSVGPEKVIYCKDFVLDRDFGFIVTTNSDIVLFEGQVTNPQY